MTTSDPVTLPAVQHILPPAWREAAVFGALWGAAEVTVGAFLHSVRVPMASVLMAGVAVALLVPSQMLVRRNWFPLRAALICAGLRALAPSGVIWGPMFAIIMQGLVVSLMFILLRKASVAGPVAGGLAALASVGQGLFRQIMLYGGDIWALYVTMLNKGGVWLRLGEERGITTLFLFFSAVALVGACAGFVGWNIGRRALQRARVTSA